MSTVHPKMLYFLQNLVPAYPEGYTPTLEELRNRQASVFTLQKGLDLFHGRIHGLFNLFSIMGAKEDIQDVYDTIG